MRNRGRRRELKWADAQLATAQLTTQLTTQLTSQNYSTNDSFPTLLEEIEQCNSSTAPADNAQKLVGMF